MKTGVQEADAVRAKFAGNLRSVVSAAVRELRKFAYASPAQVEKTSNLVRRPRLGLALGGGFARGFAHIGVLKVLVDSQIGVDALAGISIGSIVAAGFASGCTIPEMVATARKTRWSSFARWTLPRLGFATNERLETFLLKTLPCRTFERLRFPLAIVAADLKTGEAVTFREGDLMLPLRASCSFPGLFVPIEYGGRLLLDGAIVSSVPVSALPDVDLIVAVHIRSSGLGRRPSSLFEVVGESFRITQSLNEASWRDRCDLVIEPDVGDFRWDDFARADELIAAGERAARKALPALRDLLRQRTTEGTRRTQERRFTLPAASAQLNPLA
jgi:NTE family protein